MLRRRSRQAVCKKSKYLQINSGFCRFLSFLDCNIACYQQLCPRLSISYGISVLMRSLGFFTDRRVHIHHQENENSRTKDLPCMHTRRSSSMDPSFSIKASVRGRSRNRLSKRESLVQFCVLNQQFKQNYAVSVKCFKRLVQLPNYISYSPK